MKRYKRVLALVLASAMALTPVTAYAAQDTEVIAEGNSAAEIPADAEDLGGGVEELIDEPAPAGAAGESRQMTLPDGFDGEGLENGIETIKYKSKILSKKPKAFRVQDTSGDNGIVYTLSWEHKDGTQSANAAVSTNSLTNKKLSLPYMQDGKAVSRYELHIDLKKEGEICGQIDQVYELEYTGITKEDYENGDKYLETYFINPYFGGRLGYDDADLQTGMYFPDGQVSCKQGYDPYATVDYVLTAQAINAPSLVKTVISGNGQYSVPYQDLDFRLDFGDGSGKKQVDRYTLKVVFRYDGDEICTREASYDVYFDAIGIEPYGSTDFRKGETKELGVYAYRKADKDIGDVTYKWYKGDTLIGGEDLRNIYVKVEDYTAAYKCVISSTKLQEAYPDIVMKEISAVFDPNEDTGYRLKDSAPREQEVYLGEPATLFIKHEEDPGYSFDHKWQRMTQSSNGACVPVVLSENTDTLHIEKTTEDDLKAVDDGSNYILTVIIYKGAEKKPEAEIGRHTYGFRLTRKTEDLVGIDSNLKRVRTGYDYDVAEKEIEKGEDVELYLTSTVNDTSCTVEKKWYKNIKKVEYVAKKVSGNYVCKKDVSNNNILDEYGNPVLEYEVKEPGSVPEGSVAIDSLEYQSGYEWGNVSDLGMYGVYTKKFVTYGQEITVPENGVCTLPGKDASGGFTENRGIYVVDVQTKRQDKVLSEESSVWAIELVYNKSGLQAYQKTADIYAALGETVTLEVIASNKNESLYNISYQWRKKKRDDNNSSWITLQNENSKTYVINGLKEDDYGIYEVTASDPTGESVTLEFKVDRKGITFHTPETSVFRKSIGDEVTLEVKADIPASTTVSYNWYRTDIYVDQYGYEYPDEEWQILNEEKPSYTFTVLNEEDFGTYRCVARYRSDIDGEYRTSTFLFTVIDASKDITLERTTPQIQYKRPGDSASYGVRYRTDSTAVKDADIRYQWYNGKDEPIEGATGSVYKVDSLQDKDFGQIKCVLSYMGQNKTITFTTFCYSDVVIDKSIKNILKETGDDVELSVVVEKNPAGRKLTYQWYFEDDIIHGATDPSYKIAKIGERQFGRYSCKIYDGDCLIDEYEVDICRINPIISVSQNSEPEVSVAAGGSVTFEVTARSDKNLSLSYQWYTDADGWNGNGNEIAIGGAIEPKFTINYVMPSMAGEYWCKVEDAEGHSVDSLRFTLSVGPGLSIDSGYRHDSDLIGYSVKIGGEAVLMANAKIEGDRTPFYQWYRVDWGSDTPYTHESVIYDATTPELRLTDITFDDLGYYACVVNDGSDSGDSIKTLWYYVYVDNGLVVEPSVYRPRAAADGSITLFVNAKADEKITYVWEKEGEKEGTWSVIPKATAGSYKIPKITKAALGVYRCTVSTSGEKRFYEYSVETMYDHSQSREFAEKGDSITFKANIINRATDAKYTYKWYAPHPETGSQKEVSNAIASYTAKVPAIRLTGKNAMIGYKPIEYACEIVRDDEKDGDEGKYTVNVFPSVTYVKTLPKTSHPFNKRVDVQGYRVDGAKNIKVTLDARSERVLAVDAAGHGHWMGTTKDQGKVDTLTLTGNKVIFVANSEFTKGPQAEAEIDGDPLFVKVDESGFGYGYEAKSIVDTAPKKPVVPARPVPKKGTKHTVGSLIYKVTKSSAKAGTVAVTGVKKKTLTTAAVPKTVKISGYTFKVTAIDAKAFNNCKKLKKVTIEVNIASIGKQAFKGCAKLNNITIKTTKLTSKKVGSQAFKGINAKATIKVPKKKLASYKKILKAKGVGKKVKIK